MSKYGAIAAGDRETTRAAAEILKAGGNAFDAALAGLFASTVAEPVLSSLGGGGFLLASSAKTTAPVLYDFFAHTPRRKCDEVDFQPIDADFGTVTQEFHIGVGSIATPGIVKGAFDVHRELGRMPMREILQPAIDLARSGFKLSALQASVFDIVAPIYKSTPACRAQYASPSHPGQLIRAGEVMKVPAKADFLEALASEGDDLFYRGEVAAQVARDCEDLGGHLRRTDFENYAVIKRAPLRVDFEGARIFTNPPPSVGGTLIAFALKLIADTGLGQLDFGSFTHLDRLAQVMALSNQARVESGLNEHPEQGSKSVLEPEFVARYRTEILGRPASHRGTTHISVIDKDANAVSMTVSNGEGSGYVIPGTGIVLNNMLGEEDINPKGFHQWPVDTRMSSMMAPSLILRSDGLITALGSGGSNRIRTAVLQVILNLLSFGAHIEEAVELPRIHYERGLLNVEAGFDEGVREQLIKAFDECKVWGELNLFFGGVHAVEYNGRTGALSGGGDPRRGGVAVVV
ncbi:gamma-glutamyltransferase [Magnetovibrio blakemorei]|uniref:Glutathione hydrolase proenzyme n=1 Tax=Magnetovibrio blakemorei TaxID=28181 RepID=A0A1E5Q9Q6_9PROT|nr:gamma-glutamyltransferase [Magnetovibrio blakemorei]OEJ68215.1 gamma-glutamyltransferase [Magnetovibrio blakemorei]